MNGYGPIPTWAECDEAQARIEDSYRTTWQAARKPCLDPVERFIWQHEPSIGSDLWRKHLRDMLEFVSPTTEV